MTVPIAPRLETERSDPTTNVLTVKDLLGLSKGNFGFSFGQQRWSVFMMLMLPMFLDGKYKFVFVTAENIIV